MQSSPACTAQRVATVAARTTEQLAECRSAAKLFRAERGLSESRKFSQRSDYQNVRFIFRLECILTHFDLVSPCGRSTILLGRVLLIQPKKKIWRRGEKTDPSRKSGCRPLKVEAAAPPPLTALFWLGGPILAGLLEILERRRREQWTRASHDLRRDENLIDFDMLRRAEVMR